MTNLTMVSQKCPARACNAELGNHCEVGIGSEGKKTYL
jgi:hypothetical protein